MKRLGQHFLKNSSAIKEIIEVLDLGPGDRVIEIGAGHGELTEKILLHGEKLKVTAIEKDPELCASLKEKFGGDARIEILEGDVLTILPGLTNPSKSKKYKLVGNIPYYITGKLLRILSELKNKPIVSVLMIQKEVAERIAAKPPKMNRLASIVQFWAEPKIVRIVPRHDFYPEPEVDSAIIELKIKSGKFKVPPGIYYKTVKTLFAQPRKTILNNLSSKNSAWSGGGREAITELLKKMRVDPADRPQNLNIEDIERVSSVFRARNGQ